MININIKALIAFINRDGNETISKQEIDDFNKTQDKVSIFGDYFNSITYDTSISIFSNKIQEIYQNSLLQGTTPKLSFNDKYQEYTYNQLSMINNLQDRVNEKIISGYEQNTINETKGINFILNKLKDGNNIVLGDGNHTETIQHDFIAKNLDELYDNGVREIYLEFIKNTEYWALDKFYETGDISELARLKMNDVDNPESVLALIKLCKEKGIRCYAMNNPKGSLISRNQDWANVVKRTNHNQRYILVGGSAHLSTNLGDQGIDKLLGDNISVLELNNSLNSSRKVVEEPNYEELTENYARITY